VNRHMRLSLLAVAALILLALACCGECAIIRVKTDGNDSKDGSTWDLAKKTVTAALTAAASGDEVWVAKGTYVERITLRIGVGLYGGFAGTETIRDARNWESNVTTLDGNQGGFVVTAASGVSASSVVDGFTLRNGTTGVRASCAVRRFCGVIHRTGRFRPSPTTPPRRRT